MTETRFKLVYKQEDNYTSGKTIYVDTETGVNYFYVQNGYSGGLTPLIGADGKPIVTR